MLKSLKKLLSEVDVGLKALERFRKYYESDLAPDFYILDFLYNDENALSDIFSDLLNPRGSHGQKSMFLESFMDVMQLGQEWKEELGDIEVKREKVIKGYGRLDIEIKLNNNRAIIIENKPWACEQENQLQRYADYAKNNYEEWVLVYISNEEPTSINEKSSNKFKHLKYSEEIISWLEDSIVKVKPLHLRVFLEELCKWIHKKINGRLNMDEISEVKKAVLDNENALKSAMNIYKAIPDIQDELIKILNKDIENEVSKAGFRLFSTDLFSRGKYANVSIDICKKQKKEDQIFCVSFEFGVKNYNDFYWGIAICLKSEDDKEAKRLYKANKHLWSQINNIMKDEFGGEAQEDWWPWWSNNLKIFGENWEGCNYWSDSITPWIEIKTGRSSKKMIEIAKRVQETFEKQGKLDLLCADLK